MSSESILMKCGGCARFQIVATVLVLCSRLVSALLVLLPVFISHKQSFFCNFAKLLPIPLSSNNFIIHTENASSSPVEINQFRCSSDVLRNICTSITMQQSPFTSTILDRYSLYCVDRYMLPAVASSCCIGGIMFGSFFVGSLSDNFGRLIVLSISGFISGLFSILALVSPYFWLHSIARFVVGIGVSGLLSTGNSYIVEVLPLKRRLPISLLALGGWDIGDLVLCLIAYFNRNHIYIQLCVSIITFHTTLFYFVMPESFRWLISVGKREHALKSIFQIAKWNRQIIYEDALTDEVDIILEENKALKGGEQVEQLKDILKFKNMRTYLAIFWTVFFIVSLSYYTLSFNSGNFSDNVFHGTFSVAGASLLSRVMLIIMAIYWRRINVLSSLNGVAFLLLLSVGILQWRKFDSVIISIFLISSTFLVESSFSWLWVYSAEVFPTMIRTACVSTSSGCARFGALIAPQLMLLNEMYHGIAYLVCGVLAFVNFLLPLLKLPETKGYISVDNLKESEDQLNKRERLWMDFKNENKYEN